ncbi:DUF1189 family protein [Nanoarchaeota archaeon]
MKLLNKIGKYFKLYRRFLGSFNPRNYGEYADYPFKTAFTYYMSLIFNMFVIMAILFLPVIVDWPAQLNSKFDQFEEFDVEVDVETTSPIRITEKNPMFIFNAESDVESDDATVVIDSGRIYYNIPFKQFLIDLTGYSDVKEHRTAFMPLILILFVLMLPSILLILYFWFAIKYSIMILVGSLIAYLITKAIKFKIGLRRTINIAVFASSLTIVISIVTIPFGADLRYLHFVPFIAYLISGIARVGKFGERKHKKSKGGFVEVHE